MIYFVAASVAHSGSGSKEAPFKSISEAAEIAVAGDEIVVAPGIYREYVNPKNGGTDENHRIVYRSEVKHAAVITGAEVAKNWEPYHENVWVTKIPNEFFGDYNPYTTLIAGDWYFAEDDTHTGEVFLNGKAMYESATLDGVINPQVHKASWDPDFSVYKWYTQQGGNFTVIYANFHGADPNCENVEINVRRNCFYPSQVGKNYITLSGFTVKQAATQWAPPTAYQEGMVGPHWSKGWIIEDCDISNSKCSGISLGKYLQPNNENKWYNSGYKHGTQTERDAVCQAQAEGWSKDKIGSHIVRRCDIHDCGQTGIVGHLGCIFSIIEDNHIHHINIKHDLAGAEIGGIKMHAAIDVIFRRNHIHHCTRGLWLDWQAQGTRVTQNFFHDNTPPVDAEIANNLAIGEDLFIEVSHGPTLVDNNLLLSACSGRISTQGVAFVHNLFGGSFTHVGVGTNNGGSGQYPTPRYTPYHMPHRTEVAGFMTILHGDVRFYNNVFVQKPVSEVLAKKVRNVETAGTGHITLACGTKPYDDYPTEDTWRRRFEANTAKSRKDIDRYYSPLPVWSEGNAYFNGAQPCNIEKKPYIDNVNHISLEVDEKGFLHTNLYDYLPNLDGKMIDTELLGEAFEPEQKFEQPNGLPIVFDEDYLGEKRRGNLIAGPFASKSIKTWEIRITKL